MPRPLAPHRRAFALCAALSLGILAGCTGQSSASERTSERTDKWADTAKGEEVPSGASRIATITDLHQPETVVYDPEQDCYFISNMLGYGSVKDGEGYIIRVAAADLTKQQVFAQSRVNGVQLDAPKGLTLQGDTLWTADIDKVRGFDRRTGAPVGTIDLASQHVTMLNAIGTGPDGTMRVTDTGIIMSPTGVIDTTGDKIFEIDAHRRVRVVARGGQLDEPNGVAWDAAMQRWITVGFAPFRAIVYAMRPGDTTVTAIATGPGRFDGVAVEKDGRILFSSWTDSSVYEIRKSGTERIVRDVPSPAGIGVDERRHRLLVPMPSQDKVEVWALP